MAVAIASATALRPPVARRGRLLRQRATSENPSCDETADSLRLECEQYWGETSAAWEPMLLALDVRCALDCGEIKMMIDVAGATERWRKGEVEVRRRVRGTDASSLLPRFTEAAAVRAALLANETWSSELETVEKRCDEARVLLEVGFAKAPVAAPKDRATELSAGIRDTLVLKTAGDSATTRWFSSAIVEIIEREIAVLAKKARRVRTRAALKRNGRDEAWCRAQLGDACDDTMSDDDVIDAYSDSPKVRAIALTLGTIFFAVFIGVGVAFSYYSTNLLVWGRFDGPPPCVSTLDNTMDSLLGAPKKESMSMRRLKASYGAKGCADDI